MELLRMLEITCPSCGTSTRHPESTLRQIIRYQPASDIGVHDLVFLCRLCNRLEKIGFPHKVGTWSDQDQKQYLADKSACFVWIECAEKCSSSPFVAFATMNAGTNSSQVIDGMKLWNPGDVKCPQGHPCATPVRVSPANSLKVFFLKDPE